MYTAPMDDSSLFYIITILFILCNRYNGDQMGDPEVWFNQDFDKARLAAFRILISLILEKMTRIPEVNENS